MRGRPTPTPVADHVPSWRLTTKRGKAETVAILAVFALYGAFLLKLLLFSRAPGSERSISLVPFASIADAFSHSSGTGRMAFANVVGNVLIFIPLGLYASWLRHRVASWPTMLTVASVSVAAEIIQGVIAVGVSDIDDVILNCVGGLIGILTFRLLSAVMRERSLVRSAMAVLSLLTIPLWFYFLFIVRLRM
jgi:glycopeptide antibiotics resistance protein